MTQRIQVRRGTSAQWTSANPTLAAGEIGYETDTGKYKFGDGSTAWTGLASSLDASTVGVAGGLAQLNASGEVVDANGVSLNAIFARNNLIDTLPKPAVAAHRGAMNVWPQETLAGYAAASAGFVLDADIDTLSDGTLVLIHDATVDNTMVGQTGSVGSFTSAQWAAMQVKPVMPGLPGQPAAFWQGLLDRFGGTTPITAEIKTATTPVINATIASVTSRGLHRSVLLQSSSWTAVTATAAEGIVTMYLSDAVGTTDHSYADLTAAGIQWIGVSTAVSSAMVAAHKAAGFKVGVYQINSPADYATWTGYGVDLIWSDDPWRVTRNYPATASDVNFLGATLPPGGIINSSYIPLRQDAVLGGLSATLADGTSAAADGRNSRYVVGQFGFGVQTPCTVQWTAQFLPTIGGAGFATAAKRNACWIGVYLGTKLAGSPHIEAADEEWINAFVRRDGSRWSYGRTIAGGTSTLLGNTAAAATPANFAQQATDTTTTVAGGNSQTFQLVIGATSATFSCLTQPDAPLVVTYTPLVTQLAYLSLCIKGTSGVISDVRISR